MKRIFNNYKITMTIMNNTTGELEIQVPRTYARNVEGFGGTLLDHVQSSLVHATKEDHIFLSKSNEPKALAILDHEAYVELGQWNPVLIGISCEFKDVPDMLENSRFVDGDVGKMLIVAEGYEDRYPVSGWAIYRYIGGSTSEVSSWERVAEKTRVDFVFGWDDLGAPFKSTLAEIDKLGKEGHDHGATIKSLNKMSEKNQFIVYGKDDLHMRIDVQAAVTAEMDKIGTTLVMPGDIVFGLTGSQENTNYDQYGKSLEPVPTHVDNEPIKVLTGDCTGYCKNTAIKESSLLHTTAVTNMNEFFMGCVNLTDCKWYDTSNVTSMVDMFNGCKSLNNVQPLDTSRVVISDRMFIDCTSLQDVPRLRMYSLQSANEMFKNATKLASFSGFEYSPKLTDVTEMFFGCKSLIANPIIDFSQVKNLISVFENCTSLVQVSEIHSISAQSTNSMFRNCTSLRTVSMIDMSNVIDAANMFNGCISLYHVKFREDSLATDMDFTNTKLTKECIMDIFKTGLKTLEGGNIKVIDFTNTPEYNKFTSEDISIAANKGWLVRGLRLA